MQHTIFVALDTSKKQMAVAVASDEPREPVRYLGQFANTPDALRRLCNNLATGALLEQL